MSRTDKTYEPDLPVQTDKIHELERNAVFLNK